MSYEILLRRYKELKENYDTVVNCNDVNKAYLKLRKQYKKLKEEYIEVKDNWNFQLQEIRYLQQENKQLKDNWNKLKEYLNNEQEISISFQKQMGNYVIVKPKLYIETILIKIQELESGDSDE